MGLVWELSSNGKWTGRDLEGREWAWVADFQSGFRPEGGWDVLVTVHPGGRLGWAEVFVPTAAEAMEWADRFAVAWVDGHG